MNKEEVKNKTKICPKCETTIRDDEVFCHNCGTKLVQDDLKDNPEDIKYQEELKILKEQKVANEKVVDFLSKNSKYLWIALIVLFIFIEKSFFNIIIIISLGIGIGILPSYFKKNQDQIEEKIRFKEENTPKKQKEREKEKLQKENEEKEREIQEDIDRVTPFKSDEEAKGYHITAISWDLFDYEKLKSVSVILQDESKQKIKQFYFKYDDKGKKIDSPVGMSEEECLRISRQKIYLHIKNQEYDKAVELFKEVFSKDPFTGEDIAK